MTTYKHGTPPGPASRWPGQQLFRFRRDPLEFLRDMSTRYGDVSSFHVGSQMLVLISDPEMIRDVLVTNQRMFKKGRGLDRTKPLLGEGLLTSEGEFHRRQRRLAQPAFAFKVDPVRGLVCPADPARAGVHRERIAAYASIITACAARHQGRWHDGDALDVAHEMSALTLAIIGKTLFDADVEGETRVIREAIGEALRAFETATLPFAEWLDRLPVPWVLRLRRARATLDAIVYRMIAERRSAGVDRGDLLSMLLMARDTEGDGSGMTDAQLRDELLTFFIAGHETTANALAWSWYALSRHPEAVSLLHAEVDALGHDPTVEDLGRLTYTRAVVSEAMRLYPPAWIIGRRALVDYRAGEYDLPAGTLVFVSPWITHRDPRFWPNADRFEPARWQGEAIRPQLPSVEAPSGPAVARRTPLTRGFAYFPFGGGSRICIGEAFAWTELVLVLATLARRWRFDLVPGHPVVPKPVVTLRPRDGVRMVARLR